MIKIPEIILVAVVVATILGFVYPKEDIKPMKKHKNINSIKATDLPTSKNRVSAKDTVNIYPNRKEKIKASFEKLDRYCHL